MNASVAEGQRSGRISENPEAAVDATGLSADGRSSYYAQRAIYTRRSSHRRRRKTKRYKMAKWPKINAIIHTQSHLILAASVTEGPSHDSPELPGLLKDTARRLHLDRLLADSGYDAEEHHRLARQDYHIRSTVIALNPRNHGRRWPKSKYRRQMKRCFHRRKYGQRWQAESAWSRHKRRLGWVLACRSTPRQIVECHNRILTHNLMILAAN